MLKVKKFCIRLQNGSFNAIYGMCCTNNIRDQVNFDNITGWSEEDLSPTQIEKLLIKEKMFPFLSFAWGSFCTAYARRNLLENLLKLDEYCIYCDTDSLKLKEGYDKNVIDEYNKKVIEKIKKVCCDRDIPFESFSPKDIKGIEHTLGLFENETEKGRQFTYDEFITQGAKKYAYKIDDKIHITVSGVPKSGAKALKSLEEFTDNFIFKFEDTGKNIILYNDNQLDYNFRDYQGNFYRACYQYGSCILPTTYELGKSQDYQNLLSDESSKRAIYRKGGLHG